MRTTTLLLSLMLSLSSCSFFHVHKMDVEQGNYLSDTMVARIHEGMSMEQVKEILGQPVLSNMFDKNRQDYVYTFKPGYGVERVKYLTLIFRDGRLNEIHGNMYSQFIK